MNLYFIITGIITGIVLRIFTIKLIKNRTDKEFDFFWLNKKYAPIIWAFSFMIVFQMIYTINTHIYLKIFYCIVISSCISISVVDALIRKIPNVLLLLLLICQTVIIISSGFDKIQGHILGLIVALFVYSVPSMLKINIGNGDIKLAAVIGYSLGVAGFLQAMIIMAIGILLYTAYIYITKTGTVKSMAPMGPYLSLGYIISLILPIL